MKRGKETIQMRTGEAKEVNGLLSKNFLIHKSEDNDGWSVTHRPTGYLVRTFPLQKIAREVVRILENVYLPIPWETVTKDNAYLILDTVNTVINQVVRYT